MAGIQMNDANKALVDAFSGHAAFPTGIRLRLFSNNHTPAANDVLANYTEATFAGYAAVALADPGASTLSGNVATVTFAAATFTCTSGSQNIYGWYLTDSGNTKLYYAQADPAAPVTVSSAGLNTYTVTVTLTQKDTAS
jgi:hypothetical protein